MAAPAAIEAELINFVEALAPSAKLTSKEAGARHKNDCHMFVTEEARDGWTKRAATIADARMVSEKLQGAPSMPTLTAAQAAAIASAEPEPPVQAVVPIQAIPPARPAAKPEANPAPIAVAATIFSMDIARRIVAKRETEKEKEKEGESGRSGRGKTMPRRKGPAVEVENDERLTMDLGTAAQRGNLEGISTQIEAGAQIDAPFKNLTALQRAAAANKPEAIKHLVEFGADLEIPSGARGATALHMAAARGNQAACVALLESGANLWAADANGQRAAEIAQAAGHAQLAGAFFELETELKRLLEQKAQAEKQRAMSSPNFIPPPSLHPRRPGPELGMTR